MDENCSCSSCAKGSSVSTPFFFIFVVAQKTICKAYQEGACLDVAFSVRCRGAGYHLLLCLYVTMSGNGKSVLQSQIITDLSAVCVITNQSVKEPIRQSFNQPINRCTNQCTNQPTNSSANQPTKERMKSMTNRPIKQASNQAVN